jgi:hypothetical protein
MEITLSLDRVGKIKTSLLEEIKRLMDRKFKKKEG